jgi:hypothetical protein
MYKSLVVFAVLGLSAALGHGAENYSYTASNAQVVALTVLIQAHNQLDVCAPLGIDNAGCTQAAVCVAKNIAPCNAQNARDAKARVYPQTTAGREEYFNKVIIADGIPDVQVKAEVARKRVKEANLAAQSQATKDADCAANNLPAGCQ